MKKICLLVTKIDCNKLEKSPVHTMYIMPYDHITSEIFYNIHSNQFKSTIFIVFLFIHNFNYCPGKKKKKISGLIKSSKIPKY